MTATRERLEILWLVTPGVTPRHCGDSGCFAKLLTLNGAGART